MLEPWAETGFFWSSESDRRGVMLLVRMVASSFRCVDRAFQHSELAIFVREFRMLKGTVHAAERACYPAHQQHHPRRSDSEDQKNPVSAQRSNMLNRPYAG